MLVPIAIYVALLGVGVICATRWIPSLAPGRVGGMAFFVVCGLLGGTLALVGLRLYSLVEETSGQVAYGGQLRRQIIAGGLTEMLWQAGLMTGLALVVYLLAPASAGIEAT